MNPSFESLFSYIPDMLESKLIFFWIIVFILLFSSVYIKLKAGSAFILTNKFIKLFTGKKPNINDELIDDIIIIESFNFQYNTRAISLRQKNNFECWIRKYELDFRVIAKLKKKFDIDRLKIKKINKFIIILTSLAALTVFLLMPNTLELTVRPAGLIKIRDSGWFWLNNHEAESYNFFKQKNSKWVLTPVNCQKKNALHIQLSQENFNTICSSFGKKEDNVYISNLVKKQRIFFGSLLVTLAIIFLYLLSRIVVMAITYDARQMLFNSIKKYRKKRINLIT